MGAKPKAQIVAWRYYFDIHFALGKKVDEVCDTRKRQDRLERLDHDQRPGPHQRAGAVRRRQG